MVPQTMDIEVEDHARAQNQKFLHRGPIVLLTIICSTVINGIALGVQSLWMQTITIHPLVGYSLSMTAAPLIGVMFFAFLSSVVGRKPIFISLFTLLILTCGLHSLPWDESVRYSFPIHGFFRGGARIMNILAITEYSSPKHRFTYLLVESSMFDTIRVLIVTLFTTVPSSYPYVLSFQIVLGLLCVVSACRWPESPFWLASRGKLEESRNAFLWLRGEEDREELNSLLKERRSPGPLKLYWKSFFIALATISISLFNVIGHHPWTEYVIKAVYYEDRKTRAFLELIIRCCGSVFIVILVSVLSYFVKRKVLFVIVCGISIVFSYGITIWMNVDPTFEEHSNLLFYFAYLICDLISISGPTVLATVLYVEIIPVKYNTHIACVGLLTFYSVLTISIIIVQYPFLRFAMSYVSIPVNTTLSLIGILIYYFFAPETKGKTLLEIQKAYTPELSDVYPKEEGEALNRL